MLYKQTEEQCKTEEGMREIELSVTSIADELDEINQELCKTEIPTGEDTHALLVHATGLWGQLKIIHDAIDSFKTNKELSFFHTEKIKQEAGNEKFNVSATEKDARALSADERRIRNLVAAYLACSDKIILSCQSIMKYLTDSAFRNKTQA